MKEGQTLQTGLENIEWMHDQSSDNSSRETGSGFY
jgi:hypothetical protein